MPVLVAETWGWPPAIAMPSWPQPPPLAPAPRRLELVRGREARPTVVPGPSGWAAPTAPSSDNPGRGDHTSHSAQRERSRSAAAARGATNLPRVAAAAPVGEKNRARVRQQHHASSSNPPEPSEQAMALPRGSGDGGEHHARHAGIAGSGRKRRGRADS